MRQRLTHEPGGLNLGSSFQESNQENKWGRLNGVGMVIGKQSTNEIDIQDVEYIRHGDALLLARVFRPRGTGPFPVMVDLHGGA